MSGRFCIGDVIGLLGLWVVLGWRKGEMRNQTVVSQTLVCKSLIKTWQTSSLYSVKIIWYEISGRSDLLVKVL